MKLTDWGSDFGNQILVMISFAWLGSRRNSPTGIVEFVVLQQFCKVQLQYCNNKLQVWAAIQRFVKIKMYCIVWTSSTSTGEIPGHGWAAVSRLVVPTNFSHGDVDVRLLMGRSRPSPWLSRQSQDFYWRGVTKQVPVIRLTGAKIKSSRKFSGKVSKMRCQARKPKISGAWFYNWLQIGPPSTSSYTRHSQSLLLSIAESPGMFLHVWRAEKFSFGTQQLTELVIHVDTQFAWQTRESPAKVGTNEMNN